MRLKKILRKAEGGVLLVVDADALKEADKSDRIGEEARHRVNPKGQDVGCSLRADTRLGASWGSARVRAVFLPVGCPEFARRRLYSPEQRLSGISLRNRRSGLVFGRATPPNPMLQAPGRVDPKSFLTFVGCVARL